MNRPFSTSELEFELPHERIAQHPPRMREDARLLVIFRDDGALIDTSISHLPHWLRRGDMLVLNDTRVVPARFVARRPTGGRIDGLFLGEVDPQRIEVMLNGAGRVKPGETLLIEPLECGAEFQLLERIEEGRWLVELPSGQSALSILERVGRTPLPPYIHRTKTSDANEREDRQRYQTVFARCPGAVAAPTAGLHFTHDLLQTLGKGGVEHSFVTLHVGLGTFAPVKTATLDKHKMHREWYELSEDTASRIRQCRVGGGRTLAVGTTSVRVIESCSTDDGLISGSGWSELLIRPPYTFRTVDALLTNFHLPRSTLLALVMAFAGVDLTRQAYQHAIEREYRFYSYGDAMLIL